MFWSSLPALLCNQEASLVPPVDATGSWVSVVAAHLCRVPDLPHPHQVAYEPHQFLVGKQDSYLKLQSMTQWLPGCFSLGSYSLFLRLPSFPQLTSRCFSVPQFAAACLIPCPPCRN